MKKLFVVTSLIMMFLGASYAQDQTVFTQTVNLQGMLNPAYTGTRDAYSGLVVYRKEFAGFGDGAPEYSGFNLHAPISGTNMGAGLVVINEQFGLHSNLDISAAFAYRVQINRDLNLSLGLQASVNSYSFDFMGLDNESQSDRTFLAYEDASIKPNAGFGALLYSEKYFVGFSMPEMLYHPSDTVDKKRTSTFDFKQMHMFLYGGYVFDLQNDFKVKPVALVRQVYGAPLLADIGVYGFYMNDLSLGVLYRWNDAAIVHAEFRVWEQLFVGYSYDHSLTKLAEVSNGSHEISLRIDLGSAKKYRRGMRSIRYF